jgi:hypothetical protein
MESYLFLIPRSILFFLLLIFVIKQVFNIKYVKRVNGIKKTRNVLLLASVSLLLDATIYFLASLHDVFWGNKQAILASTRYLILSIKYLQAISLVLVYQIMRDKKQ